MQTNRYAWLLFDADGTLFDYDAAEARALAATFKDAGLPFDERAAATYRAINSEVWAAFERGELDQAELNELRFQRTLDVLNLDRDPAQFADSYLGNLSRAADLIDGALDVVPELARRHKLYLITNGIPRVQHGRLALSTLRPYFQGMVISGEVGHAKPDRRIFDAAFAGMGHPPKSDVLIIGDSLNADIAGGLRYGIDACWYNANGRDAAPDPAPTYEIHALSDLLSL
jgi:YjjG family noncanonical pyrimidine nucleotidase